MCKERSNPSLAIDGKHQVVSSIEISIATESKEGLLVWKNGFGLAIKGGQVGGQERHIFEEYFDVFDVF